MKVLICQKTWASDPLRNSSPTKTKSIQRLKKSHHFSNSMDQNARGLLCTPTKVAKYYPLHSGSKSPLVSTVRWWSPAKAKNSCMVRLHVFSIKISTPSSTGLPYSSVNFMSANMSQTGTQRWLLSQKELPQQPPATARGLLQAQPWWEDTPQAHLMQPGWQNVAGL